MNLSGFVVVLFLSTSQSSDYLHLVEQARADYQSGHFAASEALLAAAIRMLKPGGEIERAARLTELGDVYVSEDELPKAENTYAEALAIYKRLPDKSHIVLLMRNLAATYSLERRDDDSLRLLKQALKLAGTIPGLDPVFMPELLNAVGITYYRQGKIGKAGGFFDQALQMISAAQITFATPELLINIGAVYIAQHKFQKAEEILKQALKVRESEVGPLHPDLTFTLIALGVLYTESGRYTEAEDQYQRALKILEPGKSDFSTRIARILYALSATYTRAGRKSEAEALLARAAALARQHLSQHPDMAKIVEDYSTILSNGGKTKEANELRLEAKRARVSTGLVINAHNPF
ncbi:MAG TPA: tetratricopeptide repeat protein [Terriglobia bacterium]|nr:tetratricopeptide repeat protein [Terriglobia bacterium]